MIKVITGMHRSGTSLLARLFFEAGANMGDSETFYPANRWNAEGYYEQIEILEINIALINGPWWKLSYFSLPTEKTIQRRARKQSKELKKMVEKYHDKVIKDCRFCLTLRSWVENGAGIGKIIVCLRDPIAVAGSLRKRNRITFRFALKLWLLHNERLLCAWRKKPIWFVKYENLLNDKSFYQELEAAFRFFDIKASQRTLELLKCRCVRVEMNHNSELHTELPENTRLLWSQLLEKHKRQFQRA